ISLDVLPAVAKEIFDVILATRGKIKKCVVLDLDNTLWGGVIGDDGLSGIQIGDLGLGHAFSDFQSWLKELKKRGVLLAVCYKNNEETAREPFEKHPDFVLRMEDFSIFVENWEDKATNIRYIRDVLNLGMDSFVFIDDNPFERDLVRSMIPEITVPDLPDDPSQYLSYLRSLNLFETASFSEADAVRTEQYREEVGRAKAQTQFESFDDYLKSLEMKASFAPFDDFHIPRIAQLTQRSNQFNLRTVRYTENQVAAAASDGGRLTLYFTLRDKFGDYGLISVVIMDKTDEDTLFIDTWLMSCRVLKRGMEEFIVNKIVEVARENGFSRVIGEYLPTPKNAMVKDIYSRLGFSDEGGGRFVCDVGSFVPNKTYIVS
ncbi:MAG: HAD family hydrolase, partial [Clostridia bacterium]|nr:HAD family hydrolase [Clostridia bacterium]